MHGLWVGIVRGKHCCGGNLREPNIGVSGRISKGDRSSGRSYAVLQYFIR